MTRDGAPMTRDRASTRDHAPSTRDRAPTRPSTRCTRQARVPNPLGLHARPAAAFVKTASGFSSSIELRKDDIAVNGKSIMGVLMLAAEQGSVLVVTAVGDDACPAAEALAALVEAGFGE